MHQEVKVQAAPRGKAAGDVAGSFRGVRPWPPGLLPDAAPPAAAAPLGRRTRAAWGRCPHHFSPRPASLLPHNPAQVWARHAEGTARG